MKVVVEINRPANPTGQSFIKTFYAQLKANGIEMSKELNRAIARLGYRIEEEIGIGKFITGKFEVDLEGRKIKILELQVWEPKPAILPANKLVIEY